MGHELVSRRHDFLNENAYALKMIFEDEDHVVTEHTLPFKFLIRTRTDVTETTVDLEKGVVYVPYNPGTQLEEQT